MANKAKGNAKRQPSTPSNAELSEDQLEQVSGGAAVHKHIAGVKYEDVTISPPKQK